RIGEVAGGKGRARTQTGQHRVTNLRLHAPKRRARALDGLARLQAHHDLQPRLADGRQRAVPALQEWLRGEGQQHVRVPTDVDTREAGRHHADDGKRKALTLNQYGELAPHDIIGAAQVLAPEPMADDRDETVRRGAAVIGWGQPSSPAFRDTRQPRTETRG